jgi:hypothetical protein
MVRLLSLSGMQIWQGFMLIALVCVMSSDLAAFHLVGGSVPLGGASRIDGTQTRGASFAGLLLLFTLLQGPLLYAWDFWLPDAALLLLLSLDFHAVFQGRDGRLLLLVLGGAFAEALAYHGSQPWPRFLARSTVAPLSLLFPLALFGA